MSTPYTPIGAKVFQDGWTRKEQAVYGFCGRILILFCLLSIVTLIYGVNHVRDGCAERRCDMTTVYDEWGEPYCNITNLQGKEVCLLEQVCPDDGGGDSSCYTDEPDAYMCYTVKCFDPTSFLALFFGGLGILLVLLIEVRIMSGAFFSGRR